MSKPRKTREAPIQRACNSLVGLIVCALFLIPAAVIWAGETTPEPGQATESEAEEALPPVELGTGDQGAAPSTDETARSRPPEDVVDELLVTARKREENKLEIPESLSSFSKANIERANISGLSDISLLVPNLYMGRRTDGFPNVSIRGLGSFGNTQGVGFYLDDIQLFGDASSRFSDVERIEVLKGPQGSLYGGTNIGGAIKYVLARPTPEEYQGRIKLRAGEDSYYDADLMLNVPLGGTWAARFSYFGETDESFLNNPNSTRLSGGSGTNSGDVGDLNRYGARGSIAGNLTEQLSVYASVRYNNLDGPNSVWSRELSNQLTHNRNIDTTLNPRHERETIGWSLEVAYEFDNFTLTSITSNSDTDSERESDLDVTQENILDLFRDNRIDVFTQEFRLTSAAGEGLQWQLGGYFQDYDRAWNGDLLIPGGVVLNPDLTGDPPMVPTIAEESVLLATGYP